MYIDYKLIGSRISALRRTKNWTQEKRFVLGFIKVMQQERPPAQLV